MSEQINAHLRSWENAREILQRNVSGVLLSSYPYSYYKGKNDILEIANAISIYTMYYRTLREDSTPEEFKKLVINSYTSLTTLQMILSNFGVKSDYELFNLLSANELPEKCLNAIKEYLQLYTNYFKEIAKDSRISNKINYENYFGTQGQTDFLINFPKLTQRDKILCKDFPRAKMFADNETKRIITVWQLAAFYDHSWLNSDKEPDEVTCRFWIAFDSLLTEEQSNKLSYIINAAPNELSEQEKSAKEMCFSKEFRTDVIKHWESTFQDMPESFDFNNNLPDRNKFQRIMYLPDEDLDEVERSFKIIFLQKAVKVNKETWIKKTIDSLHEPKQVEMPEKLQNAMSIINEIDNAKIDGKVEDNVLDDIYIDYLGKFFKFAEKNMSKENLLNLLHYNKNYMLIFSKAKGTGFLKYCASGEITEKDFNNKEDFVNVITSKLKTYPENKRQKILNQLVSRKSKLHSEVKAKIRIESLNLTDIIYGEAPLNEETLPKFLDEIYSTFGDKYETVNKALNEMQNNKNIDPYVKKFIEDKGTEILHPLLIENSKGINNYEVMSNLMIEYLKSHPQSQKSQPLKFRNNNNKTKNKKPKSIEIKE